MGSGSSGKVGMEAARPSANHAAGCRLSITVNLCACELNWPFFNETGKDVIQDWISSFILGRSPRGAMLDQRSFNWFDITVYFAYVDQPTSQ